MIFYTLREEIWRIWRLQ